MRISRNNVAVDRIDTELAEIDALVGGLRLLFEGADQLDMKSIQSVGVTVSFIVADKIAEARQWVPRAYVFRVPANNGAVKSAAF